MTGAPDYGRAFALWRGSAGDDWTAYTRHPFVERLRDGSLPRAAFLDYLVQDYLFLFHFARAWALAAAKAETLAEMRIAARTVDALVNEEMRLHVEVCAAAGIDEAALSADLAARSSAGREGRADLGVPGRVGDREGPGSAEIATVAAGVVDRSP